VNTREILILKTLEGKHSQYSDADLARQAQLVDKLLEEPEAALVTKNVCARLTLALAQDMEQLCGFLHLSKREFVTMAIVDMVDKARAVLNEFEATPHHETTEG
jgi:hypothetical protein